MSSMAEYESLLEDRPEKFAPDDVNFREAKSGEPMCASCVHWYRSAGGEHDVCEILRTKDEQVPWNWVCDFFNTDREHYPLFHETKAGADQHERE